eukprot:755688-Rhodomonas_salina.1
MLAAGYGRYLPAVWDGKARLEELRTEVVVAQPADLQVDGLHFQVLVSGAQSDRKPIDLDVSLTTVRDYHARTLHEGSPRVRGLRFLVRGNREHDDPLLTLIRISTLPRASRRRAANGKPVGRTATPVFLFSSGLRHCLIPLIVTFHNPPLGALSAAAAAPDTIGVRCVSPEDFFFVPPARHSRSTEAHIEPPLQRLLPAAPLGSARED